MYHLPPLQPHVPIAKRFPPSLNLSASSSSMSTFLSNYSFNTCDQAARRFSEPCPSSSSFSHHHQLPSPLRASAPDLQYHQSYGRTYGNGSADAINHSQSLWDGLQRAAEKRARPYSSTDLAKTQLRFGA